MLKNNIEKDLKGLLIDENLTQAELAEKTGTSAAYVSRLLKKNLPMNKMFVDLCDELGYDIEIQYIKK